VLRRAELPQQLKFFLFLTSRNIWKRLLSSGTGNGQIVVVLRFHYDTILSLVDDYQLGGEPLLESMSNGSAIVDMVEMVNQILTFTRVVQKPMEQLNYWSIL
jgi:hypothetical protein